MSLATDSKDGIQIQSNCIIQTNLNLNYNFSYKGELKLCVIHKESINLLLIQFYYKQGSVWVVFIFVFC
jgi:hypothetical protein